VYEQGSAQGNRVLHVLEHPSPNAAKPLHTLFNVDRTQLVGLIDEAWAARQGAGVLQANGGNRVFDVAMVRAVEAGGETTIQIVVRDGTTKVITAYPVP
jgi:filamentous hemagglutinin